MDWTQTITLGVAILGYITAMILFLYHLNEKNIEKLESGMKGMESRHREDIKEMRAEHRESLTKMDVHWRELFTYMNNKIDEVKKPS